MKGVVFLLLIAVTRSHCAFNDQPTAHVTLSESFENAINLLPLPSQMKNRIREKWLAAESLLQERVYHGFNCAMLHFKSTSEHCYKNAFSLHGASYDLPEVEIPDGIFELMNKADFCVLSNGTKVWYGRKGIKRSFVNWYAFISRPESIYILQYDENSLKVNSKLIDYFNQTQREELEKNNPSFTDLDTFFKYVAALLTRIYKLGCLYNRDAFPVFHLMSTMDTDFIKIFQKILPRWTFTKTDMDVINIVWKLGYPINNINGKFNILRVGYRLSKTTYQYYQDSIIPASSNCPKAYDLSE